MTNLINRALAAEKKLFILLAAAVMVVGCNQNPPSVGETGTVTPVDDPTEPVEPDEPANSIHISYVRNESLKYTFTGELDYQMPFNTMIALWEIIDPGLQCYRVHMEPPYVVTYTFPAPGKALITLSTSYGTASITVDVY